MGKRNPSVVMSSTFGVFGQRDSSALQHARRRGFAHGDGARDADDVGNLAVLGAEKALRRLEEALRRRDVKREQARQRQIDFDDFFERDRIVERFQPDEIVERQRQRRVGAQRRPFGARKMPVGRKSLVVGDELRHRHSFAPRAAFSARPDCFVRRSSSRNTSSSEMSRASSMTQKMIERVRGFIDERASVALHRRDHRFDRLFAEFLGDARHSGVEQGLRIGGRGAVARGVDLMSAARSSSVKLMTAPLPNPPPLRGRGSRFRAYRSGLIASADR